MVRRRGPLLSPVGKHGRLADRFAASCPHGSRAGDRGQRLRRIVSRSQGQGAPTPAVTEKYGNQIVLLNMRGELLQETDNGSQRGPANIGQRIWVHDLLGDGLDELLWCDSRTVRAMRPGAKGILWESEEMPTFFKINSIQPAGKGYPATIAVENPQAMAYGPGVKLPPPSSVLPVPPAGMVGLAGPTGKARWRCEVAYGENGIAPSLLETGDPNGPPRISAHGPGSAQTCYYALATDGHGCYLLPKPTPRRYDAEFVDRRLLHPLPWNRPDGMQSFQEDWSGTWIVVLIVVAAVAGIVGWWPGKLLPRGMAFRPVVRPLAGHRNDTLRSREPRTRSERALRLEQLVGGFHERVANCPGDSAANRDRLVAGAVRLVERELDSC